MASSFLVSVGFFVAAKQGAQIPSHIGLLLTVAATSVVWIATTYLTRPTDRGVLIEFYRRIRPPGPGWTAVRAASGVSASPDSLPQALLGWVMGCTFVYAALFGAGSFLYGRMAQGFVWLAFFVVSAVVLIRLLPALWSGDRDAGPLQPQPAAESTSGGGRG